MQFGNSISVGFKIINQKKMPYSETNRQLHAVENPGEIGQLETPMPHGAGHSEACGGDFRITAFFKESLRNNIEACIFLRWKFFIANVRQLAIFKPIKRQVDFGSAHIPRENHRVISSLPLPLASVGGSNAAASLSSRNSRRPFFG